MSLRRGKSASVNIMTGTEEVWFSVPPFTIKGAAERRPRGPLKDRLKVGPKDNPKGVLHDQLPTGAAPSKEPMPKRVETADEGRWFLGGRLVQSLRDDNIAGYAQCWESAKDLLRRAAKSGGKNAPEDLAKLSGDLAARDVRISRQFELLRDRFKELTKDLSSLKIESASGAPIRLTPGLTILREPALTVRVDKDTVVEIPVDSAACAEVRRLLVLYRVPGRVP